METYLPGVSLTSEMIEHEIRRQDYSHSYTTAVEHVLELYAVARLNKFEKICELGSYKGISTVGLALAAKQNDGFVCAVDLCDEIVNATRVEYWQTCGIPIMQHIFPYKASAMDFLSANETSLYDMIFHDAGHGNHILPELHLAWSRLTGNGVLAIHDWEQISKGAQSELLEMLKPNHQYTQTDNRGRELTFLYK